MPLIKQLCVCECVCELSIYYVRIFHKVMAPNNVVNVERISLRSRGTSSFELFSRGFIGA